MIKAVIFDMDGVLIDSEPANLQQIRDFFEANGKVAEDAYLFSLVGRSAHDTWDLTSHAWGEAIPYEAFHSMFQTFGASYRFDYPSLLFADVKPLLRWLKETGYLIAVASSSKMRKIDEVLEVCGIASYFDAKISGEQFQRSKPDPEIYLASAKILGCDASECIAVEDSTAGIQSCNAAHMKVIAKLDDRFGADSSTADFKAQTLMDVRTILLHEFH